MARVFLAMPHRGLITAGSAAAVGWATGVHDAHAEPLSIQFAMHSSSLLAQCFNSLWVRVLNAPGEYDYFAMLHDDVQPEHAWLDTLISILNTHDADMVSCVVPIRDGRGLTSTAVFNPQTKQLRRLTIRECCNLPAVFDAETAGFPGHQMMLNTGCWVFKLKQPWPIEELYFRVSDRIIKGSDGNYRAQTYSEDWQWSMDLNRRGAKLLAAGPGAVKLHHEGPHRFDNFTAWGAWERDEAAVPIVFDPPADTTDYPLADAEVFL